MNNPYLDQEKAYYLILNGLEESQGNLNATMHYKDARKGLLLSFRGDTMDLFDCRKKLTLLHSFTGIAALDIVAFMMLMHITGAISLKAFARSVRQANAFPVADIYINSNNDVKAVPL